MSGSLNEEARLTSEASTEARSAEATISPMRDRPAERITEVRPGSWGESDVSASAPREREAGHDRARHATRTGDADIAHGERGDEDAPVKSDSRRISPSAQLL